MKNENNETFSVQRRLKHPRLQVKEMLCFRSYLMRQSEVSAQGWAVCAAFCCSHCLLCYEPWVKYLTNPPWMQNTLSFFLWSLCLYWASCFSFLVIRHERRGLHVSLPFNPGLIHNICAGAQIFEKFHLITWSSLHQAWQKSKPSVRGWPQATQLSWWLLPAPCVVLVILKDKTVFFFPCLCFPSVWSKLAGHRLALSPARDLKWEDIFPSAQKPREAIQDAERAVLIRSSRESGNRQI